MTPKERVAEMQSRAHRQRAVTMLEAIKRRGEAVRNSFAHGSCDICSGPLVRYETERGFICAAGHRGKLNAATRRLENIRAERSSAVSREHDLIEARALQSRRRRGDP